MARQYLSSHFVSNNADNAVRRALFEPEKTWSSAKTKMTNGRFSQITDVLPFPAVFYERGTGRRELLTFERVSFYFWFLEHMPECKWVYVCVILYDLLVV